MEKTKLDKKMIIINLIISILLIAGVLYFVGVGEFINELINIDLFNLFLAVFFLLLVYVGMITRTKLMLDEVGAPTSFWAVTKAHFVGMLCADFTPARAGYFASVGVLNFNNKIPSEKALLAIFGPQIIDFIIKVSAGTIAVFYLITYILQIENAYFLFIGSIGVGVVVLSMILLLFSKRFLNLFSFAKKFPLAKDVYELFERMQANSHALIKLLPKLIPLAAWTWVMKIVSWYFVAKSVGINLELPFPEIGFYFFFQPLVTMLEFVPSPTLAGLGLSESASILVFSLFGIGLAKASAFALVARFKTVIVNLVAVPELMNTLFSSKERLDFLFKSNGKTGSV